MKTTIELKIQEAKEKRAALVLAEADLKVREAEAKREARKVELAELLEATLPKVARLNELRAGLLELLERSDSIMARRVAPAWLTVQAAAAESKFKLEAVCAQQRLPEPNFQRAFKDLAKAAPWLPLPLVENANPDTGEVTTNTHPAYLQFQRAFSAAWTCQKKA